MIRQTIGNLRDADAGRLISSAVTLRILTATALVAVLLPSVFLLPVSAWNTLCIAVAAVCSREWAKLCGLGALSAVAITAGLTGLLAFLIFSSTGPFGILLAGAAIWLLVIPVVFWQFPRDISQATRVAAGALIIVSATLALVSIRARNPALLVSLMAIVWVSDSAAFFAGRVYGRRKLAANISPGKTWEGVWGALLAVLAYALLSVALMPELVVPSWGRAVGPTVSVILIWLGLAVAGIVGDLAESWAKRLSGVKDSGSILPGHGGLLDRVDALLPLLPIAALIYLE